MRTPTLLIAVLTGAFSLLVLNNVGAEEKPEVRLPKEATLEVGKKEFSISCMACHGPKGEGDGPAAGAIEGTKPRNFTKDPFKNGDDLQSIFDTITNGIDGTPMISWKTLPEWKRWALAKYVKSLRPKPKKK